MDAEDAKVPEVIPPRSIIRLVRADKCTPAWKEDVGRVFRVGYYSRQDGLNVIWMVNDDGVYEQATDREYLLKYFEIIKLSRETDLFGDDRPVLGKLRHGGTAKSQVRKRKRKR